MCNRMKSRLLSSVLLAAAFALPQTASAGRVIVNNDEWTFTDYGFSVATPSTTTFAGNLASYMNTDGGTCNLLVYSDNFGLTGLALKGALTGAGCSVTYSTGAFDLATLSAFDGVLLAGTQYAYNAVTLSAFVDSGHSAYIAAGTGIPNEHNVWDSFIQPYGFDFGMSYNGIVGDLTVAGGDPLLAGVSDLYFKNGNTVGLYGSVAGSRIIATQNGAGLIGVYGGGTERVAPQLNVPEPATLALLGVGLIGLGFSRRRVA